jgi:hypothetical protein
MTLTAGCVSVIVSAGISILITFVNFAYFFYLAAMSILAIFRAIVSRLTKRQRTAAVVNSRVRRL